jgi:hypothetical protein
MLDVVLIVIVLALTIAAIIYGAGCELLLESDSTRDTGTDVPLGGDV